MPIDKILDKIGELWYNMSNIILGVEFGMAVNRVNTNEIPYEERMIHQNLEKTRAILLDCELTLADAMAFSNQVLENLILQNNYIRFNNENSSIYSKKSCNVSKNIPANMPSSPEVGDIYLVDYSLPVGQEFNFRHYSIILNCQGAGMYQVAPITSKQKSFDNENFYIGDMGLPKESYIRIDKITTVSQWRMKKIEFKGHEVIINVGQEKVNEILQESKNQTALYNEGKIPDKDRLSIQFPVDDINNIDSLKKTSDFYNSLFSGLTEEQIDDVYTYIDALKKQEEYEFDDASESINSADTEHKCTFSIQRMLHNLLNRKKLTPELEKKSAI